MRTRCRIHNKGSEHPYFVTPSILGWIPVFTHKDHFEIPAGSLQPPPLNPLPQGEGK